MPDTPAGWFERAGYRQAGDATDVFLATGADTPKAVPGPVARGRRVRLFVDATPVDGLATKGSAFATANHRVVPAGGDGVQGDKVGRRP